MAGEGENKKRKAEVQVTKEDAEVIPQEKTAAQLHFERLEEVMKRVGAIAHTFESVSAEDDEDGGLEEDDGEDEDDDIVIEDIVDLDDEDDEDEDGSKNGDEDDKSEGSEENSEFDDVELDGDDDENNLQGIPDLSEEEVADLRHVLITPSRKEWRDKVNKLFLGKDTKGGMFMLNTGFSTKVFDLVPKEIKKIMKKSSNEQFDHLYAMSKFLEEIDMWLFDYENGNALKETVISLGQAWKEVLAKSNVDLNIDEEFTRPGVEKFLENFTALVEQSPEEGLVFAWN